MSHQVRGWHTSDQRDKIKSRREYSCWEAPGHNVGTAEMEEEEANIIHT